MYRKSFEVPSPALTRRVTTVFVEDYPLGHAKHAARGPEGTQGWYRSTVVFAKPGQTVIGTTLDLDAVVETGESAIRIHCGFIRVVSADPAHAKEIVLHARNTGVPDGVITHAELAIYANGFDEALVQTQRIINRVLGAMSVFTGQPIDMKIIKILEERTGSRLYTWTAVGNEFATLEWNTKPDLNLTKLSDPLATAFACFREGMNSFNPFYRFLSFYKVVEYCLAQNKRDARKAGRPRAEMTIPLTTQGLHKEDVKYIIPHAGKTFTALEYEYKKQYRHAMAHLIPDQFEVNPDDAEEFRSYDAAMPVVKYMAREMLMARFVWETTDT